MEDVNRIKLVLVEKKRTNKWLAEQLGVFYLQDECNWEVLITLPASERAIKLDNGITKLMEAEKNLKNALPSCIRYRRDIPSMMKYAALTVISDGSNTRMGSQFTPEEYYYAW